MGVRLLSWTSLRRGWTSLRRDWTGHICDVSGHACDGAYGQVAPQSVRMDHSRPCPSAVVDPDPARYRALMQSPEQRTGPVHLRRADPADARGIAAVHVHTWQQAYRGLVPDEVLGRLSVDAREGFWRAELSERPAHRRPWVAESEGRTVGFVSWGISRDLDAELATGEVYALYVAPGYWRMGIGRLLLEHAYRDLRASGFLGATLWVPAANSLARSFYEALGWRLDGATRCESVGSSEIDEVRYRRDL